MVHREFVCQFMNCEIFGRLDPHSATPQFLTFDLSPPTAPALRSASFAEEHRMHCFQHDHRIELQ